MDISRKLKLALACLAVSSMTVACTNDDNPVAAPAKPSITKPDPKPAVDEKEDPAVAALHAKIATRKSLSDQLLLLANSEEKCDRTEDIMSSFWMNNSFISGSATAATMRASVRVLGERVAKDADPACRMAVIAKVSKKMRDHYVNNPMTDFATSEEDDAGLALVETYLTALQPILKVVNASLALRDYVNQPIFSIAQRLEDAQARIEGLKSSADSIQRQAASQCTGTTGTTCADKVVGALAYVTIVKKSIESYQDTLDGVAGIRKSKVGDSIVDAMLEDVEKRVSIEEGNIADVRKNLE